ncbi:MAG: hypothetical protein M5U13_00045 [Thermoanaerobaculia bacterium]|nr:hypothetical protein [Thermoanaerobaculia bacterium]
MGGEVLLTRHGQSVAVEAVAAVAGEGAVAADPGVVEPPAGEAVVEGHEQTAAEPRRELPVERLPVEREVRDLLRGERGAGALDELAQARVGKRAPLPGEAAPRRRDDPELLDPLVGAHQPVDRQGVEELAGEDHPLDLSRRQHREVRQGLDRRRERPARAIHPAEASARSGAPGDLGEVGAVAVAHLQQLGGPAEPAVEPRQQPGRGAREER